MTRTLSWIIQPRRSAGYSMVELLIAMGIFAIGFVALAAMFPAAAHMQKKTADAIVARAAAEYTRAIGPDRAKGVGVPGSDDGMGNRIVTPLKGVISFAAQWPLADRSYPTSIPGVRGRDFFVVPVFRFVSEEQGNLVVAFITKPDPGARYPNPENYDGVANSGDPDVVPKVVSINVSAASGNRFDFNNNRRNASEGVPDQVRQGDLIADSNGAIYTVTRAEVDHILVNSLIQPDRYSGNMPNAIWFVLSPDENRSSPVQDVVSFFAEAGDPAPPFAVFVDNESAEFVPGGGVTISNAGTPGKFQIVHRGGSPPAPAPEGSDGGTIHNKQSGGKGWAKFVVDVEEPGQYEVYVRWLEKSNRHFNCTISVFDGVITDDVHDPMIQVGQLTGQNLRIAPSDDLNAAGDPPTGGIPFQRLPFTATMSGTTMTILFECTSLNSSARFVVDAAFIRRLQ